MQVDRYYDGHGQKHHGSVVMRVYRMAHCVCLFNIKSKYIYPAPEQGSGILFSSESVHDLRVGERHLAMSLYKLKAYDIPKLNYQLERATLSTALTTDEQSTEWQSVM